MSSEQASSVEQQQQEEAGGGGLRIHEVEVDGLKFPAPLFPIHPRQHLNNIKEMTIRPNDVIICAFGKSGTHWMFDMTSMLLRGSATHDPNSKINLMLEFIKVEDLDAMPSPRVLNSHLVFRFLPRQLREQGARVVYVDRNPKDVAVSLYHHMQGLRDELAVKSSMDEWLQNFHDFPGFGVNWYEYVQDWEKVMEEEKDLNILWLHFEDIKEDTAGAVRRLDQFLGTGASEQLVQEIAQACSFSRLKEADKKKTYKHDGFFSQQFLDKSGIYRKGQVGDWKNWMSEEQSKKFDDVFAERMKNSKLRFRYTL